MLLKDEQSIPHCLCIFQFDSHCCSNHSRCIKIRHFGWWCWWDRLSFQDPNSKVRFFIGNPQTGGYGITLTEAKAVIYYSNSYDLEKRLQSEDRAHRIGQKNKVTYIDMMADDTVDEKIVESLRNKVNIATEIMGEDLREWI